MALYMQLPKMAPPTQQGKSITHIQSQAPIKSHY